MTSLSAFGATPLHRGDLSLRQADDVVSLGFGAGSYLAARAREIAFSAKGAIIS